MARYTADEYPNLVMDELTALCDSATFDRLLEYSASLPTATTFGKVWKRRQFQLTRPDKWFLGQYVPHEDPSLVGILWRDLEVVG